MKKIILAFCFLVLTPLKLQAMILPTDTVDYAVYNGAWIPGQGNFLGPGTEQVGYRFILNESYHVTDVHAFLRTRPDIIISFQDNSVGNAELFLNKGSNPFPVGQLIPGDETVFQSPKYFPSSGPASLFGESNLDLVLDPGDYWFIAKGGGRVVVGAYQLQGELITPEPLSILLFGAGVVGLVRRKKNVSSKIT